MLLKTWFCLALHIGFARRAVSLGLGRWEGSWEHLLSFFSVWTWMSPPCHHTIWHHFSAPHGHLHVYFNNTTGELRLERQTYCNKQTPEEWRSQGLESGRDCLLMHLVSQACSWSWHSSEGCCPDLQGIDVKTRYRSKRLEAGVPEHGCAPTWSWTISCHVHSCQQVVVNKNVFMEYAHRVPFHQFNGISIKGGVHLSYLSIQVRLCAQHSSPGAGCGAPSPVWVLLCEPKSAGQSRLQVVLSTHSGCPSLSFLCCCVCLGYPLRLLD